MTQQVPTQPNGTTAPAQPAAAQPPAQGGADGQPAPQGPPPFDAQAALQIIEQRRQQRAQEEQAGRSTKEVEDLKKQLSTFQERETKYQAFFDSLKRRPKETLMANGFKEQDVAEMYKAGATEGTPAHQIQLALDRAHSEISDLKKQLGGLSETYEKDKQGYQETLTTTQKNNHIRAIFNTANPETHGTFLAWFGDKPQAAYDLASEFSSAWCNHHKQDTCPYPVIQAFLEEVARKEAEPLIGRIGTRLGYVRPETPVDPKAAPAKKSDGKAPKVEAKTSDEETPFELLSKEEQRKRTEKALRTAREARGKK